MKTRAIEVARAWRGSGGDSGKWDTQYYDIPIDTPEDQIEQVALDECRRAAREYHHESPRSPEINHCWIYCIPDLNDPVNDPDDEEVE